ncbi:hypothetical protein [Microbacterium amylolyticum]|uniref:Bacterial bifunctional deaminase-reductase C-terminal domain-containing protein n=1 Tax=Microbacterium amylolyticum TaxID=936337 RepID=A0ABS4ZFV5_9MICO|nr:hypothetical protein [Microbacterium amylolyticum]MBP2435918.1 hypothetical protein [Microbacterium amylolyticum]
MLLGIAPVILGAGNPHFTERAIARPLELIETRPIDSGGVLIRYRVPATV